MSSGPAEADSNEAGSSDTTLEIKIKTLDSASHSVRVNKDISIPALKRQLEPLVGVPATDQRLIWRGRVLKDDQLLSTYRIEDGHTLHLVPRPEARATEGDQSNAQGQTEPAQTGQPGHPRTQVTASLLVGSFPANEAMPDFNRIVSAVLGVNPNELGGEQGVHGQRGAGSQNPNQLFAQVSTDALTTLSLYINRMEQMFFNGGLGIPPMPSTTATANPPAPPPPAPAVPPVSAIPSRPLTSPAALGAVFRRVQSLLTGQAAALFNGLAGQFENEASLTDVGMRGELQAAAVWNGTVLQQLGALLLELGRTTLTLHMGTTPAEAIVNSGPAVFISPSGPNPIMVQPTPFQPLGTLSPRTFPGVAGPRSLNIHIHTSDAQQTRTTMPNAAQGNAAGENDASQQGVPGTIVQETVMVFEEDGRSRNESPQPQPQPQPAVSSAEGINSNVPMQAVSTAQMAQVAQVLSQLGLGTVRPQTATAQASDPLSALLGTTLAQLNPSSQTGVPVQVPGQGPVYLSMQFDSRAQQAQPGPGPATAQPTAGPPPQPSVTSPEPNATQQQPRSDALPETSALNNQVGTVHREPHTTNVQTNTPVGLGMGHLRPSLSRSRRDDLSRRQASQTSGAQGGASRTENNLFANLMGQLMRSPALGSIAQQAMGDDGSGTQNLDIGRVMQEALPLVTQMLASGGLGASQQPSSASSDDGGTRSNVEAPRTDNAQENDSSHRQAPSGGGDSAVQKLESGDSAEAVLDSVARTAIRDADILLSDEEMAEVFPGLSHDYMSLLLRDLNARRS